MERRVRHRQLKRRLTAAQDEVVAALGEQKQLYFALEDLLGQRTDAREEALFNLGFEVEVRGGVAALLEIARNMLVAGDGGRGSSS